MNEHLFKNEQECSKVSTADELCRAGLTNEGALSKKALLEEFSMCQKYPQREFDGRCVRIERGDKL